MGNIDPTSSEMKQREHILAKCLQFLRLLARYIRMYLCIVYLLNYKFSRHDYVICDIVIKFTKSLII